MSEALAPTYRDRRGGLIVFGVLQILLGLICGLLVLVLVAGAELAQRTSPGRATVASAIVVCGTAAVYFVAVGVGSIRARRWARALSVVVGAIWTVAGLVASLTLLVVVPKITKGMPRPTLGYGCLAAVVAIGGVILPLIIFLFYRSPDVRATCEARDLISRWTDRVPLPVLAMVIIMAFGSIALMSNVGNPVLSAFGRLITGPAGSLAIFAVTVLFAFIALQLYRLKESGWWMLVLVQIIALAYGAASIMRTDFKELARRARTPDMSTIYGEPLFVGVLLTTWLAHFAFVLYLRRFFAVRRLPRTRRED